MNPDTLIIGGGIIGYSTALALVREGRRVQVLERGEAGRESSWAGGGILFPLPPWKYGQAVTALVEYSLGLSADWMAKIHQTSGVDPEFRHCGMLVLPPFDQVAARDWLARHPQDACFIQARRHAPALQAPDGEALWLPHVAQTRNPRLLKALRETLIRQGVAIHEHHAVNRWHVSGSRVSAAGTPQGNFSAAHFVVCAGAWSRAVLGEYALDVNIYPVKGQMLLYQARPDLLSTLVLQEGMYLIPRLDGHILVGSTLEDTGFDKETTEAVRDMLHRKACQVLPALQKTPLIAHWAGLRPGSPDNIPTMDRHPVLENLFINSGHFRYGVTMAPASAEIMKNMILQHPQAIDVTPYQWPGSG